MAYRADDLQHAGVAKYLMSQEVHEAGYKVVMTGEGWDELFAGYPAFRKDMFLH